MYLVACKALCVCFFFFLCVFPVNIIQSWRHGDRGVIGLCDSLWMFGFRCLFSISCIYFYPYCKYIYIKDFEWSETFDQFLFLFSFLLLSFSIQKKLWIWTFAADWHVISHSVDASLLTSVVSRGGCKTSQQLVDIFSLISLSLHNDGGGAEEDLVSY